MYLFVLCVTSLFRFIITHVKMSRVSTRVCPAIAQCSDEALESNVSLLVFISFHFSIVYYRSHGKEGGAIEPLTSG